jgi:uncharacterized protein (TIGR03435 family)
MRGGAVRGGRYDVKDASMLDLITTAYGVQADRVQGGPAWLASDRFDIIAKAPAGATQKTVNLMLQSLLAERFRLAVHKDTKPMPAYALTVGKGKPKLKEASGSTQSGCQNGNITATAESTDFSCHNITMQTFAETLRYLEVPGMLQTIPVVDATGLEGAWDFDFKFTSRAQRALNVPNPISLLDAVDKQLGLRLEVETTPLEVLVVESVSRPTANAPDVATKLPPPLPAEFEVATIRPSGPDEQPRGNFQNGRLDVQALPLKELIKAAWSINSDDLIAGMPKFAESAKFDIVAKASNDPAIASQIDDEALLLMLRTLLVDRFKVASHMEERAVPAYVLSAAKPKLQRADPANRTECKEGPGAGGNDPRAGNPMLNRMLTCQNMTMAQFAEHLPNLVPGYVQTQVADETKLDGAFDFTFAFSGINVLRNALQGKGGDAAAADPSGALSLQEALNKQLGLKLELKKRNAQVLVVDHVEEKPTEN